MPVASITIARDEILGRLKAALDTFDPELSVVYEDARKDQPREDNGSQTPPPDAVPPAGKPWVRVGLRHAGGEQSSLGGATNGRRRQNMSGLVFAQVFTPAGDGHAQADLIVQAVLDAYRTGGATASGVQFRSARFAEIGKDGAWFQTNCLIDFEYDQFV